jgi:hypothetical protein
MLAIDIFFPKKKEKLQNTIGKRTETLVEIEEMFET